VSLASLPLRLGAALSVLALVLLASTAPARILDLEPAGGARLADEVVWSLDEGSGPARLTAKGHPLSPTLSADGPATLSLRLDEKRELRFLPLGIGVRGDSAKTLDRGPGRLSEVEDLHRGLAVVDGAWLGVDELYRLSPAGLKHDLLIHAEALAELPAGDLRASWLLELPAGHRLEAEGAAGLVLRDENGTFAGRIPEPVVADSSDAHWRRGLAWFELGDAGSAVRLDLFAPESWLRSPERSFPLHLDPSFTLQPWGIETTGFVDEFGSRNEGLIDSGTLSEVGFGEDCRGYAEFDTSSIPDDATIIDVRLRVWLSNHDNVGRESIEPFVEPLRVQVVPLLSRVTGDPFALHGAIGGTPYVAEIIPETGPDFCPASFEPRIYDLGLQADLDLTAQLIDDFFSVGFLSDIVLDTEFDHIDYVGFEEVVGAPFGCPGNDLPGSRITLLVETLDNQPPVCDAGGPYGGECPSDLIQLDGSASFDPDDDPLTYSWTTDCAGLLSDASAVSPTLQLDPACAVDCTVTLTVDDGLEQSACSAPVFSEDTTPPVILDNRLETVCLWPPRHDMYCLEDPAAWVSAEDACTAVSLRFIGCVSDQPDEAREEGRPENGDGHFENDCQVSTDGQQICVRVERAGNDPEGRHYGILVEATDDCGNAVVVEGSAFVPHDRRGGSGGQDDPCLRGNKSK